MYSKGKQQEQKFGKGHGISKTYSYKNGSRFNNSNSTHVVAGHQQVSGITG